MTILYCNSKEHTIEDAQGNPVTIEQAKLIIDNAHLEDCNLSFQRLASLDFDWDKFDEFYRENP